MLSLPRVRRKWLSGALMSLLFVVGVSATGFADLRIVTEYDDELSELLVKNGRIVSRSDPQEWFMIDCVRDEITYVRGHRYWQGPTSEFAAPLEAQFEEIFQAAEDVDAAEEAAPIRGLFGDLLGSQKPETVQVRVTELGEETVAGYPAIQYRVETGDGSQWKTHEIISISSRLLWELEAEIGDCTRRLSDFSNQLQALIPLGDSAAVHSDPTYLALFSQGYPVRSVMTITVFGFQVEMETVLVEVSRDPLDDSAFEVPSTYRRSENLSEFF